MDQARRGGGDTCTCGRCKCPFDQAQDKHRPQRRGQEHPCFDQSQHKAQDPLAQPSLPAAAPRPAAAGSAPCWTLRGHRLAWRPGADRPREHPLCVNGAILGMRRAETCAEFVEASPASSTRLVLSATEVSSPSPRLVLSPVEVSSASWIPRSRRRVACSGTPVARAPGCRRGRPPGAGDPVLSKPKDGGGGGCGVSEEALVMVECGCICGW